MGVLIGRSIVPNRFCGLGSVYGKAFRDPRLAIAGVAGFVGLTLLAGGGAMAEAYGTPAARAQMAAYATSEIPAAMSGMYGNPFNVGTVGGFLSWHYSGMFALIAGLWSILALSGTLAGDLASGSLEFVLSSPVSRRSVALQKVAGHLSAVVVAMVIVTGAAWLSGVVFYRMEGDQITLPAAAAFALKLGLMAALAGSVAFALAPFFGRRGAAGLAGAFMLGSYVVTGWAGAIPAFKPLAGLTWFSWTQYHVPLAGVYDWPSQLALVVATGVLLAVGVEGFVRRDIVAEGGIPMPRLPAVALGLRGPVSRAFGEMLPTSLAWGVGIGAFGFVVAAASRSFAESIGSAPDIVKVFQTFFPGDPTSPAWLLQLAFADFGLVLVGLAAATFVAAWSADETSGRLEMLLATPLSRARSALASGVAAWVAVAVTVALVALSLGLGVTLAEGDPWTPTAGTAGLAMYGSAMAGIGFAIGGLWRPAPAGPAIALLALVIFLDDMLAEALNFPDWVHQLALSAHLGKPMLGVWDVAGLAACVALAVGGATLGAWGMRRRDVGA
jgi:ABC-2 type transport system permease protein